MTIRSRLLLLLLPTLIAFVGLIALFFYFNWSREIMDSFKLRLRSIVVAAASSISAEEIQWIHKHLHDPDLKNDPTYQIYRQKLVQLRQKLPIMTLYVIRIELAKESHLKQQQGNVYYQIFLLDASDSPNDSSMAPGELNVSETEEHRIYLTKEAFVTPIYEAYQTDERLMSAYAPILNAQGEVIALLGADAMIDEIDRQLRYAIVIISLGACITILLVIITVFFIADRISKPVQQLNQAALDIAAGNYEANIQVKGPKEIVELANTFNTMSECLVENISRLRESSLIRERMYGEYECALLLQNYLFQKIVENFKNPHVLMRSLSLNLSPDQRGFLLKLDRGEQADLKLSLIEAKSSGFSSIYELITTAFRSAEELEGYPQVECHFLHHYSVLRYKTQYLFAPLVWSIKSQEFIKGEQQEIPLHSQDMIFFYNSSLIEQFGNEEKITTWFGKVLRHFAEDGLDTIHTMLTNELNFLVKRDHVRRNFHILGLQIKHLEISS